MARHKEKDDEAGGEGLGHLATRKRLWRDADGNIIQGRRPIQQDSVVKKRQSSSASQIQAVVQPQKRRRTVAATPPSPSLSNSSSTASSAGESIAGDVFRSPSAVEHAFAEVSDEPEQFDFLGNSNWAQAFNVNMNATSSGYNDIFKQEESSLPFSAPFAAPSYYDWLSNGDGLNTSSHGLTLSNERMPMLTTENSFPGSPSYASGSLSPTSQDPLLSQDTFEASFVAMQSAQANHEIEAIETSNFNEQIATMQPEEGTGSSLSYETGTLPSVFAAPSLVDSYCGDSNVSTPSQGPELYSNRFDSKLPIITNEARNGLLAIIKQRAPRRPDGSEITTSDPLLSLLSLQHYSDLFFTRFNTTYPLLQLSTFRSTTTHPYLLLALLLLGATYSDKEAQILASSVHSIMRPLIHASEEFTAHPKLWMLQTILLVECFGKGDVSGEKHDMSQLYHGLLLRLGEKNDEGFTKGGDEACWDFVLGGAQRHGYGDLIAAL